MGQSTCRPVNPWKMTRVCCPILRFDTLSEYAKVTLDVENEAKAWEACDLTKKLLRKE